MKSNAVPLTDRQLSSLVENAICVTMSLKNLLEDELTLLQKYFDEMKSAGIPSHIPEGALFYSITSSLYRKGNLTMGELSKSISAPMSSTTRMMNWLVDKDYAARLSDPDDRRIVRVALTDEGRRLHEYIESHIIKRIRETMQLLTKEEQASIIHIFEKLSQVFNFQEAKS